MFKKLFIYSVEDRKFNRISGLFGDICKFLFCIPIMNIITASISYFYRPLTSTELTIALIIMSIILLAILAFRVVRYIMENITTYAINEKGQVVILNMSKSAASYMEIQTLMQNMNSSGTSKLKNMASAGAMVRDALNKIDEDGEVQDSLIPGRAFESIDRVESFKKKIVVYGNISGRKKHIIRRVYSDSNELERYLIHIKDKKELEEFEFYQKKSVEDFLKKDSRKPIIVHSIRWILIVAFFMMFALSSGINTYARIKSGDYVKESATIVTVFEDKAKYNAVIEYKADGKTIEKNIASEDEKYEQGNKVDIYYAKDFPEKYMLADNVGFHLKPYLIIAVFGEALILIFDLILKK